MNLLFVMDSGSIILLISLIIVSILIGTVVGVFLRVTFYNKTIKNANADKQNILKQAQAEAQANKKETINETKAELAQLKKEHENDLRERRQVVIELEKKAIQKEDSLVQRSNNLDKKEELLLQKELKINSKKDDIEALETKTKAAYETAEAKLLEISKLSEESAKQIIFSRVEAKISKELDQYIKNQEELAKETADNKAKELISQAIQKYASETVSERTTSAIDLPNDDVKGKIIGREGRNIRTIEALTGVDLIIDDTPDTILLSGFDPLRREIAKRSIEKLISDGRIHPGRIEEIVEKTKQDVDILIREMGEKAVFETGIGKVHPDLIKYLGRLNFRTSYGQNVLQHSLETAFIAGKLAVEIGEDEILARRAGLLHDIGKAIDHEIEGTHSEIGSNLAIRYKEPLEVVDAIASHHNEVEVKTVIATLVAAADAISASRPGARNESKEYYFKRLESLEKIGNETKGVEKTYAISAGREIRVIVKPEEVNDLDSWRVAREIKDKIEASLSYPGTIKVTVVRETRATETAK